MFSNINSSEQFLIPITIKWLSSNAFIISILYIPIKFQNSFTSHDIVETTKTNKAQENYDRKQGIINIYLSSKFTIKDIEFTMPFIDRKTFVFQSHNSHLVRSL